MTRLEPPQRIIICANTGDWWDPAPPDNESCPHANCEGEHHIYVLNRCLLCRGTGFRPTECRPGASTMRCDCLPKPDDGLWREGGE